MHSPVPLTGLQDWYLQSCDDEWDQAPGIQLDPLDAGWALHVDLEDAGLAGRDCPEITIHRTADDWLHAWADARAFHVDCGPLTLTEAIKTYLAWAGRTTPGDDDPRAHAARN